MASATEPTVLHASRRRFSIDKGARMGAGAGVRFGELREAAHVLARKGVQRVPDSICDGREGYAPLQEGVHGDFPRPVEHRRHRPARGARLQRERKTGKFFRGEGQKGERSDCREIGLRRAGKALGVGEGELDGDAHIGIAELGERRAVRKTHERMDDALGMDDRFDRLEGRVIQPLRFDDLISLVEQRRAVHGDLRPHLPGGMAERVARGDTAQLLLRLMQKRSSARREDEFAEGGVAAEGKALENGGMLAVHGDDLHAPLLGGAHDEFPAADKGLLVRKRHPLSRRDRRERIGEPRKPARSDKGDVAVLKELLFGMCPPYPLRRREGRFAQGAAGRKFPAERGKLPRLRPAGEGGKAEAVGIAAHDVRRLPPDASRTADECNVRHISLKKRPPCGGRGYPMLCGRARDHDAQYKNKRHDEARVQRGIDPVEHAAVTRQEIAHILDPEFALEGALHQVAELRERRDDDADPDKEWQFLPDKFGSRQRELRDARELHAAGEPVIDEEHHHAAHRTADETAQPPDDRLVGADVGRKFGGEALPEPAADGIGKGICHGADDKDERDRRIRIEGEVVADRHDDQEHRGIQERDERVPHRFQAHPVMSVDEDAENDGDPQDKEYERDVRRVVAPDRPQRVVGKPDAQKVGIDDVRSDIGDHAELRKDHRDKFLRSVELIPEGADHFVRPEHGKKHDEHIEKQLVYEDLPHKEAEQHEHIDGARDHP